MNKIQNDELIIEVCEKGAELNKLYSKKHNIDFLWKGDPKYWRGRSPILFPIVGKLKDNETIIDGETYNIGLHGFAYNSNFNLINETENSLTYLLSADENTRHRFPYNFELAITYLLNKNSLYIKWDVKNIGEEDMYFSIGGHPAFNVPFEQGENIEDYYLSFETNEIVEEFIFEVPYIKEKRKRDELKKIAITPEIFKNDALIYSGVNKVTLTAKNSDKAVTVNINDFPYLGIWSQYFQKTNEMAPFVCIEPWYGIADLQTTNKNFKEKLGINKLNPGAHFIAYYNIEIS